jgi:hypothetical protein
MCLKYVCDRKLVKQVNRPMHASNDQDKKHIHCTGGFLGGSGNPYIHRPKAHLLNWVKHTHTLDTRQWIVLQLETITYRHTHTLETASPLSPS